MEFTAGIPGTVGGWIAMNAGIGVREQKDVVLAIEIVTTDGREERCVPRAKLDFRYRDLVGLPEGALVLSALFAVSDSTPEDVKAEIDRLLLIRGETQPLHLQQIPVEPGGLFHVLGDEGHVTSRSLQLLQRRMSSHRKRARGHLEAWKLPAPLATEKRSPPHPR